MDPSGPLSLPVTQTLRSAALEDCALCQETLSSSELAAKTQDGDLEGAWGALAHLDVSSLSQTTGSVKTAVLQLSPTQAFWACNVPSQHLLLGFQGAHMVLLATAEQPQASYSMTFIVWGVMGVRSREVLGSKLLAVLEVAVPGAQEHS